MRQKFCFLSIVALVMTLFITVSCDKYDYNSGIQSIVQGDTWKIVSMVNEDTNETVDLNATDLGGEETTLSFAWDNSFTSTGYFKQFTNATWSFHNENYRTSRGETQELNCRFDSYINESATIYIYDGYNKFIAKAVKVKSTTSTTETPADTTATN